MTTRDRAIAKRVRVIRFHNQLSIPEFGRKLGVTFNQIAGVEYERTPLTVQIADKISEQFDVNLHWLATGRGRMQPGCGLILLFCPQIKGFSPFSDVDIEAFLQSVKSAGAHNWRVVEVMFSGGLEIKSEAHASEIAATIHLHFDQLFQEIPLTAKRKLLPLLIRTLVKFDTDWVLGNQTNPGENITMLPHAAKKALTDDSLKGKVGVVKSDIQKLIEQVKRKAARPGAKADLARTLDVAPARITEWLSGKKEPGGDYALRLQKWVESPAHQK